MPELTDILVNFKKCKICQHYSESEHSDICNECLDYPVNTNSETPIHFKKKESTKTNGKR